MELVKYFEYNSVLILSYFFISLIILIISYLTHGKSNDLFFCTSRGSLLNPRTYIRLFTHSLGHYEWSHFSSNFLYILLIGPMIEEKYGTINLLVMMVITSGTIGIINFIRGKHKLYGASGIVFMLIILSSFVNMSEKKIPLTLVLIFIFYIVNEIIDGISRKKDHVSHMGHILGAICGAIFGFYFNYGNLFIDMLTKIV